MYVCLFVCVECEKLWRCVEVSWFGDVEVCVRDDFDRGEDKDDEEGRTVGKGDATQHLEMVVLIVVIRGGIRKRRCVGIHLA